MLSTIINRIRNRKARPAALRRIEAIKPLTKEQLAARRKG